MPTIPGINMAQPTVTNPDGAAALAAAAAQAGFYQAALATMDIVVGPPSPSPLAIPVVRDWLDTNPGPSAPITGLNQLAAEQGQPKPLSWWQMRRLRGPTTTPQPVPVYLTSRPYSRGAGAHAPHFGTLAYNPIGGGVVAPYKLPPIAGPGARYVFGAIWFGVQDVPTSLRINPTIPIETVNALIASSRVAGQYITTG